MAVALATPPQMPPMPQLRRVPTARPARSARPVHGDRLSFPRPAVVRPLPGSVSSRGVATVHLPTAGVTSRPRHLTVVTVVPGRPNHATFVRRRLMVLAGVLSMAALSGLAIGQMLVNRGGTPASTPAVHQPHDPATYVVEPGDTLWSIATHHRGEASQAGYVRQLVEVNGGPSIEAGQVITLP